MLLDDTDELKDQVQVGDVILILSTTLIPNVTSRDYVTTRSSSTVLEQTTEPTACD